MAALLSVPSFASKIVEDSRAKFVLDDEVAESSLHACANGKESEVRIVPENAFYDDGNGTPFRIYRIALPTRDLPTVSIASQTLVPLAKNYCSEVSLGFASVSASSPVFRDGLWITDVRVPLLVKQGSSAAVRKSFRLRVDFNGSYSGSNPGKRALSRVKNQAGASRFGVPQVSLRNHLRKAAADQTSDVTFFAEIKVGDKNMATFEEDGLYAVDYRTIRSALLVQKREDEIQGVKVDELALYTASQDTLPDVAPGESLRNPNQIFEVPIEVRDHSQNSSNPDGIFGDGDSIVFVGYGSSFWKRCDREDSTFVNGKMDYFHSYSPYSYYQHFLLGRIAGGKGLRLDDKLPAVSGSAKDVEWMRYARAEKDAILRDAYFGRGLDWEGATGKEWFWLWHYRKDTTHVASSVLNATEMETLPGFISGGRQYASVTYFPYRSVASASAMYEDDQNYASKDISEKPYSERMDGIHFEFFANGNGTSDGDATLIPGGNFRLDNPGLKAKGNSYSLDMLPNEKQYDRFDGYTVAYQWNPTVDTAEWLLPGSVSGVIKIPVESDVQVMKFKNLRPVGLLPVSSGVAKDSVSSADDIRYLAFREDTFRSAYSVVGIPKPNENVLTKLNNPNSKMEYLIIAPEALLNEAVELAEFRSDGSAVSTIPTSVVAVEDIYRRYTAGRLSPVAIRNYLSYVYSVCPNFKYVLLAGSGNYDYRGSNGSLNPNLIPPFEKEDAVTEDFFGVLDSGEVVRYGSYDLDLSVGRLTVYSAEELANYVEKVKEYEKLGEMDYSDWRSNFILAADDAKNGTRDDNEKSAQSQEQLAHSLDSLGRLKNVRWNASKIYLVEYTEDAAGQKKEATEDLINLIDKGALYTVYFGHGSKTDWAAEGLLKASYVGRLSNKDRYTIISSFSCTVGRFDDGKARSLSEEFVHASEAGAIAAIGANRETYGTYNVSLAKNLVNNSVSGDNMKLGDAFMLAKGTRYSSFSERRYNNEHYMLHGEPVIQLPRLENQVKLDQKIDTLKALDKVKLSGSVQGMEDGYVNLVFTGGRQTRKVDLQNDLGLIDVDYPGSLIYSENVSVKNGRFETEFVTPRKLSFGDTAAEIRAWAYSPKNAIIGRYWQDDMIVSGMSTYADSLNDTIPPVIEIQTCYNKGISTDASPDAYIQLQSPACLQVVVSDSTALDYREQADEGISFEIVGVKSPFHPATYTEQTSKLAKVRMNFTSEQYPAGSYAFKVRAQDVLGNVSTKTVALEITDDMVSGLADVYNAPNPMGKKGTTFYFKNLAVNRESKVNIYIYNQNGKLVQVLKDAVSGVTRWNGRDMHGRLLANGLYHYVVRSEVAASGSYSKKTWTKKQKLLISR